MKTDPEAGTRDRILFMLRTRGPRTARELAGRLSLTAVGVRQHLVRLEEERLVTSQDERRAVGRPARVWRLSAAGEARFPQGYAELTVELLAAVRSVFGTKGVERLIAARTRQQITHYRGRLARAGEALGSRVAALARLRSDEGYMAEWKRAADGSFTLIENHCPICAAAEVCQGLCGGELALFRAALGKGAEVERTEHVLAGARRCAYRVRPR